MQTKKCCRCSRVQALSFFYKDPRKADGRRECCKGCTSLRAAAHRKKPEVQERIREQGRAYYARNLEKERARSREKARKDRLSGAQRARHAAWYARNKDKKAASNKAWWAAHPGRLRDLQLQRRYGITAAERSAMEASQKGLCACCGVKKRLVVDHNHRTGKVRALLCYLCNSIVGHKESHTEVDKLADAYLLKHS